MALFNAGLTGIQVAQVGLSMTGHNIANVNTPGYARQRIVQTANVSTFSGGGYIGAGASVRSVDRVYDEFLNAQSRDIGSQMAYSKTLASDVDRLSQLFGDETSGISPALNAFFTSLQDAANRPSDPTARSTVIAKAGTLAGQLRNVGDQMDRYKSDGAVALAGDVQKINNFSQQIAALNQQIALGRASGQTPNDLEDQRDQALVDLGQIVRTSAIRQTDGSISVFLGSGQPLVINADRFQMGARPDPTDPARFQLTLHNSAGVPANIDVSSLGGGSLAARLNARNGQAVDAENSLGRLALVLADTVNRQNGLGIDANGALGGKLFTVGAPTVRNNPANAGNGLLDATIADSSALKASDYRVTFTGSSYSVARMVDGTITNYASLPQTLDGITLSLNGSPAAGDSFLVQPTRQALNGFATATNDPARIALAGPVKSAASLSNLGSATVSAPEVVGPAPDANLQQPVTIRFTSGSQFSVSGTGTGNPTGVAFVAGATISYNGWSAKIDGAPRTGDVFTITPNSNPSGDNRNGLALAALQSARAVDGATFSASVGTLIATTGSVAGEAKVQADAQEAMLQSAEAARTAVSGVNLDEEAANLIRYQQAYQAAAKYLQIASSLFSDILSIGH